jgi:hypothetical protein
MASLTSGPKNASVSGLAAHGYPNGPGGVITSILCIASARLAATLPGRYIWGGSVSVDAGDITIIMSRSKSQRHQAKFA